MIYMLYRVIGGVGNFANIMNANDPGYNCSEHVITNHKIRNTSSRTKMVSVTKTLQKKRSKSYNTMIYTLPNTGYTPIAVVS